jgi:hypothetical protein
MNCGLRRASNRPCSRKSCPAQRLGHRPLYYKPAREVGGDLYDFLPLQDGDVGLVIGDVSERARPPC